MFTAYRSALELSPSIRLEQTHTCAVFEEEDSLSGCSSTDHSTNGTPDESTEPTDSSVDLLVSDAAQKVAGDDKESKECWD